MNSSSRAVRLVLDEGKSVTAVARELDPVASALGQWVKQARADRSKRAHRPDDRRAPCHDSLPVYAGDPQEVLRLGAHGLSARAQRDPVVRTKLRAFLAASGHRYGRPRLWQDLREDGEAVSEKRVRRLMRVEQIQGPVPDFCARFLDDETRPVKGITVSFASRKGTRGRQEMFQ